MKTIVVTGASAGVGLAIADRFASGGWQVAVLARGEERLQHAAQMLRRHGNPVVAVSVDMADAAAVAAAADQILEEFGAIDAWVNNAMSTVVARADEITPEEYARVTATTYLSQIHGTLSALRHMQGHGAIVQISSALAIRAAPMQAAYCGAKAAIGGFTDALRSELIADGSQVSLTVVYLPGVNTPQPKWSRNRSGYEQVIPDPVDPRLCAQAVWTTVQSPQREVWVGRTTMKMAIGQLLAPGFSDRQAAAMVDQQRGAEMSQRTGNLDISVNGPAQIDGPETGQVSNFRSEYVTSRGRSFVQVLAFIGLLGSGAIAGLSMARLFKRISF